MNRSLHSNVHNVEVSVTTGLLRLLSVGEHKWANKWNLLLGADIVGLSSATLRDINKDTQV